MSNQRFTRRGTVGGVFECRICTRRTRHAGQAMNDLCPECDRWTQIENSILDEELSPEELADAEARIAALKDEARKKGGVFD